MLSSRPMWRPKGETLKSDKVERKAQCKQAIIEQVIDLFAPWRKPKGDTDELAKLKAELAKVTADLAAAKNPQPPGDSAASSSAHVQNLPPRPSERLS